MNSFANPCTMRDEHPSEKSKLTRSRKTTMDASKRHTFRSFKQRVDALNIDPRTALLTRAFDYAEESHFISTLEYWRELNISTNFIDFVDETKSICNSLAQIIHHKRRVFEAIKSRIEVNDVNSLQPLLELLTQFIHDLGPEFLPFYPEFLDLIIGIARNTQMNEVQSSRNAANVLDWCFNSLALAFRYLSKELRTEILSTYSKLRPVFESHKKVYLARFCAEALAHLLRKADQEALKGFANHIFSEETKTLILNEDYRTSIVTLFSESIINTHNSMHSRGSTILTVVINTAVESGEPSSVSLISDILLNIAHVGTKIVRERIYSQIFALVRDGIELKDLVVKIMLMQIFNVLIMIDEGKIILDWQTVLDISEFCFLKNETHFGSHDSSAASLVISHIFNSVLCLSYSQAAGTFKYLEHTHQKWVRSHEGKFYLDFLRSCCNFNYAKCVRFGVTKHLQDFINHMNESLLPELATLVKDSQDMVALLPIRLSAKLTTRILLLVEEAINCKDFTVAANFAYLLQTFGSLDLEAFMKITIFFEKVLDDLSESESAAACLSVILETIASHQNFLSQADSENIIKQCFAVAPKLSDSEEYFRSIQLLISRFGSIEWSNWEILLHGMMEIAITNLGSSNLNLRSYSITLLELLIKNEGDSKLLHLIRLANEVPFDVAHSNDMRLKVRQVCNYFQSLESSVLSANIMARFSIGLLTNKFKPSWIALNEAIQELSDPLFVHAFGTFIKEILDYEYAPVDSHSTISTNLRDYKTSPAFLCYKSLDLFESQFEKLTAGTSLVLERLELAEFTSGQPRKYDALVRGRALNAVKSAPSIAEKFSEYWRELLARTMGAEEQITTQTWSMSEKADVLAVFAKLKNSSKGKFGGPEFTLILDQLSSGQVILEKAALEAALSWNNTALNKYRGSIRNLLDERLFKDELQTLLDANADGRILPEDGSTVMPLVLRIIYGKAKGQSSQRKTGRRFTIASLLPNLLDSYVLDFFRLMSHEINLVFGSQKRPTDERVLRLISGFLNLLHEALGVLGKRFKSSLKYSIEPLVSCIAFLHEVTENSESMKNLARGPRLMGMKCLHLLFLSLNDFDQWEENLERVFQFVITPRLANFESENLQQISSLLQIILEWINHPSLVRLYYRDNKLPARAVMALLNHHAIKPSVVSAILDFCIIAITMRSHDEAEFFEFLAIVVDGLLKALPHIFSSSFDDEINQKGISLVLLLIQGEFIEDANVKRQFVHSLRGLLTERRRGFGSEDKATIYLAIASMIKDISLVKDEINEISSVGCKALQYESNRNVRNAVLEVFESLATQHKLIQNIVPTLRDLDSYKVKGFNEIDFDRRLNAFQKISDEMNATLLVDQWAIFVHSSLFHLKNEHELSIRAAASFVIKQFLVRFAESNNPDEISAFGELYCNVIEADMKRGFDIETDEIRCEYIDLFAFAVRNSNHIAGIRQLQVLTNESEDNDFFQNFTHIQLGLRQKAVRQLAENCQKLSSDCIVNYIFPLTKPLSICKDEKLLNLANEVHDSWSALVGSLEWVDFLRFLKVQIRLMSRSPQETRRDHIHIVVKLCYGLFNASSKESSVLGNDIKRLLNLDHVIKVALLPQILRILQIRDDETVVQRTPLVEAAVTLLASGSDKLKTENLTGVITSTCQVLRSRNQQLRDSSRKSLSKISALLGPKYFKFILKLLRSTLSRGSQIHVLSFTIHYLLLAVQDSFQHGDVDDSSSIIVDAIMEDIFGSAGEEKDSEGYVSAVMEVKARKSNYIAEIVASKISLERFHTVLVPMQKLLKERLSAKTKSRLNELLHRYALGLRRNEQSSKIDILRLAYEIHKISEEHASVGTKAPTEVQDDKHFLVEHRVETASNFDETQYRNTLQQFSLEILTSSIVAHLSLKTVGNLQGFLPRLLISLESDDEELLKSTFRVLEIFTRLPFEEADPAFFEKSVTRAFAIVESLPSTTGELGQLSLRHIASIIRYKQGVQMTDASIAFILQRISPDLEDPESQSLAFKLLKAILYRSISIPEVYDIMEKVASIMIVNHSREIRKASRTIYYQFLMEYEQGVVKLQNAFKQVVGNLGYPTESGRQSAMEFLKHIIAHSNASILNDFSVSFFIGLSNRIVCDDSTRCRAMASVLLEDLLGKLGYAKSANVRALIKQWLALEENVALQRCGLMAYRCLMNTFGFGEASDLDEIVLRKIKASFIVAENHESEETWEIIHCCLVVYQGIVDQMKVKSLSPEFKSFWLLVVDLLLYPHPWVRKSSADLISYLIDNLKSTSFDLGDYNIQTIAYRSLRQLHAPSLSDELGLQAVHNVISLMTYWADNQTPYMTGEDSVSSEYETAIDFIISKLCHAIRFLANPNALKHALQILALATQVIDEAALERSLLGIVTCLYRFAETNEEHEDNTVVNVGKECLRILRDKLGENRFARFYSMAKADISELRKERREKKALLAVSAPEVIARRKLKKHERAREKRRHQRDGNGMYKSKKKRRL